jgi:hypothetical protein
MYGKGWMTGAEVVEAAQKTHYAPMTLYRILGKVSPELMERRKSKRAESRGGACEYRVVETSTPPTERIRATKQQIESCTDRRAVAEHGVRRRAKRGAGEVQRVVWASKYAT